MLPPKSLQVSGAGEQIQKVALAGARAYRDSLLGQAVLLA